MLAHAELFLAVEPEQALVVPSDTIKREDVQSPVAEPLSLTGQHAQPGTDLAVTGSQRPGDGSCSEGGPDWNKTTKLLDQLLVGPVEGLERRLVAGL